MTPVVNVRFMDFPNKGSELVTPNEDGSYTILINSKLPHERQRQAYLHALKHIKDNHFDMLDVQAIEHNARFF